MTDSQVEVCACGHGSCEGNCAVYPIGTCQKATNLCDGLAVARVKIYEWYNGEYEVQIYDVSDDACTERIELLTATCDVCDTSLNAEIKCKGSNSDNYERVTKTGEFMPVILYVVVTAVVTLTITVSVATIIYVLVNTRRQRQAAQYERLEQTI